MFKNMNYTSMIDYLIDFYFQEARATFRELLCESTLKIDSLAKKLGTCIDKSRPYYDARFKAKEVRIIFNKYIYNISYIC